MKHTTLNKIRAFAPCSTGWNKLLKHLGKTKADDDLLPFEVILDSNGLDDALWCMRSAQEYDREWRLFAVWCARQVQHINTDPRVTAAIDAAEDYANGRINYAAMAAARDAAMAAARDAAWDAARDAAWAAASASAGASARDAAVAAAWASARASAWASARASAWASARDAQSDVFRWIVNGGLTQFESEE